MPEKREQIQLKCKERYGFKTPLENKEIFQRTVQTTEERYGVKHFTQSRQFLNQSFQKFKKQIKDYVTPLFDENEFEGYRSNKILKWKCAKCGNEFEQAMTGSHAPINEFQYIPRCWKCYPHLTNTSVSEEEIFEFCKQFTNDLIKNDKNLIGIELDLVIPSKKIAIEFNGVYYHSTQFKKPGLHLEKTKKCNEKGYRLIHVWEDEWIANPEDIKKRLENAFNECEEIEFKKDKMTLDFSWFNGIEFKDYQIVEFIPPQIVKRMKYDVEDCGKIVVIRKSI